MPKIETLREMKQKHLFAPYIDYIRFPKFRNIEKDARIDFPFPLTVFVGQNGCGKSSALHALFGAPSGKSTGAYWFETAIDPIADTVEDPNCFIYSYDGAGQGGEVLKTRIRTRGKPERWDTSQSLEKYGMLTPGNRLASPVEKRVVYINFRTAQNAFEKAFHDERPPRGGVQDELRWWSVALQKVLRGHGPGTGYRGATHKPIISLTETELGHVSEILGRQYSSARIIEHRFYRRWGYSVLLQNSFGQYSEAFAGSGESAVVLLVHEIISADDSSLLLLDEPETSLHPGAQAKVREFLLKMCLERRHQIVVSTHSPEIVRSLPEEAVKVFTPTPGGKFRVLPNMKPSEAFFFLGLSAPKPCTIRVEDKLAEMMVNALLSRMEDHVKQLFDVRFEPGGHSVMKTDAAYAARNNINCWYLFDGDALPPSPFGGSPIASLDGPSVRDPAIGRAILRENLKNWLGVDVSLPGNSNDNEQKRFDRALKFAQYADKRFGCFPSPGADNAIWNSTYAFEILLLTLGKEQASSVMAVIKAEGNMKTRFLLLSEKIMQGSQAEQIESIHRLFVARWAQSEGIDFDAIKAFLERARLSCD